MECYTYLRNVTDLLSDGKTPYENALCNHSKDVLFHLVHWLSITQKLRRISQEPINLERKSYLDCSSDTRWEFGRVTKWLQTLRSWNRWTHQKSTLKDSMRKRWYFPKKMRNSFFQPQMDESNLEEIKTWEHPPWYGITQFEEKVKEIFLENQKGVHLHHLTTHFRMPVRDDSMECVTAIFETYKISCLMGKTLAERRFGEPRLARWANITPLLRKTNWDSTSSARKSCQVYFSVLSCTQAEAGKETFWVADIEELDKMDASEIHARRLNAKEVLNPQSGEHFQIPHRRWNSQTIWRRSGSENIHLCLGSQTAVQNKEILWENQTALHHLKTHRQMMVKQEMILSPFQGTAIIVTHVEPRVKLYVREKSQSQFHCDTLTKPEVQVRPWMWCLNAAKTIIGISKGAETYQIRGLDSHYSPYWKKNHQTQKHGPESGWRRSKRHPGQRFGKKCQKQRIEKNNKSVLSKNRSVTMREGWEESISLIQQMRSSRKLSKMPGESWKFRCRQQCLARPREESTGRLVALLVLTRQKTHASLKPTNLRENVQKELLHIKIMKTTLQEKESVHRTITILCSKFSYAFSN